MISSNISPSQASQSSEVSQDKNQETLFNSSQLGQTCNSVINNALNQLQMGPSMMVTNSAKPAMDFILTPKGKESNNGVTVTWGDYNNDGKVDAILYESQTKSKGMKQSAFALVVDDNFDGIIDSVTNGLDKNNDGYTDTVFQSVDTDFNGVVDQEVTMTDANKDHLADEVAMSYDFNQDGTMDAYLSVSNPDKMGHYQNLMFALDKDYNGTMEIDGTASNTDGDNIWETQVYHDQNAPQKQIDINQIISADPFNMLKMPKGKL